MRTMVAVAMLAALLAAAPGGAAETAFADEASLIYETTKVQGGLVVHLNCGNGLLTAALRLNDRYLVHGLLVVHGDLDRTRALIRARGLYGPVSIERFSGSRLPYADNTVNLLISDGGPHVPEEELLRVLVPGGTVWLRLADRARSLVKPRLVHGDDWSHLRYSPGNNPVSRDSAGGPPACLQWAAEPARTRSPGHLASVSAAVSSAGRLASIVDEGPDAAVTLPARWNLVVRDAFNGVRLWTRPLDTWEDPARPRHAGPLQLGRRLVMHGDYVFVTPGLDQPVIALDAATGRELAAYPGTEGTGEILFDRGTLYLVVASGPAREIPLDASRRYGPPAPETIRAVVESPRRLMAVDAATGNIRWVLRERAAEGMLPCTLALVDGRLYFQNARHVVCCGAEDGAVLWRAKRATDTVHRPASLAPALVVDNGVVISADIEPPHGPAARQTPAVLWDVTPAGHAEHGRMFAFSAENGAPLWEAPCLPNGNTGPDVFVISGQVWSAESGGTNGLPRFVVRDLRSGAVVRSLPVPSLRAGAAPGHPRCCPGRATARYLLTGSSTLELLDYTDGTVAALPWIRGACGFGILPANGLFYAPPHGESGAGSPAALNWFNALAPAPAPAANRQPRPPVIKGPAYSPAPAPARSDEASPAPDRDWPTYRHDAARSGCTPAAVPCAGLRPVWRSEPGGRLSAPVIARGKVFVARIDEHTVQALDAASGQPVWQFTANGRVDSPPTVAGGLAVFGSADGQVYALNGDTGVPAWLWAAEPAARRIVAGNQLESAWPVHGSVLVVSNRVYLAAGRASVLDGGIHVYALDLPTGRLLRETVLSHPGPGPAPADDVVFPDILTWAGGGPGMRGLRFDPETLARVAMAGQLLAPTGFLDDSWNADTRWCHGMAGGAPAVSARLLCLTDDTWIGFVPADAGTNNPAQPGATVRGELFAAPRAEAGSVTGRTWRVGLDLHARALLVAGDTVFCAGPAGDVRQDMAALRGERGVRLVAVSAATGETRATCELPALPGFDGMAAAAGALFLTCTDGTILRIGSATP